MLKSVTGNSVEEEEEYDERRRSERRNIPIVVELAHSTSSGLSSRIIRSAVICDISASGAMLVSEELIEPGSVVSLKFSLPVSPLPLSLRAETVRAKQFISDDGKKLYEIGLHLLNLTRSEKREIENYVKSVK